MKKFKALVYCQCLMIIKLCFGFIVAESKWEDQKETVCMLIRLEVKQLLHITNLLILQSM